MSDLQLPFVLSLSRISGTQAEIEYRPIEKRIPEIGAGRSVAVFRTSECEVECDRRQRHDVEILMNQMIDIARERGVLKYVDDIRPLALPVRGLEHGGERLSF